MARPLRPLPALFLPICCLIQGIGGLIGGVGLVSSPDGSGFGMPAAWLQGRLFENYLIPGLILFTVLGIFPLTVAVGLWRSRAWAWWASLAVGGGLVIWIVTEIVIIGYRGTIGVAAWLVFGLLGVLILVLALAPATRRYFGAGRATVHAL